MQPLPLILLLFAITTALSIAASRLKIPYPAAMVTAGLFIGAAVYLFPPLEALSIRLDPEILFTALLPPLLYAAAWNTSWNGFRSNLRPIILLAVGAVIFTTAGIAAIAVWCLPGFTWAAGFVLGAIVSPPDAVAVTAVTERLRIPRRIVTILDGESLVNDASALVVYKFAVAALLTGAFSLSAAMLQFPLVAGGGILIGWGFAWLIRKIHLHLDQPQIETALTLLSPYAAYIVAEHLHASGVLAVVTCGIVLSRHASEIFSAQTRLIATTFWSFLTFVLNGLVFILIGLQLPTILRSLHTSLSHAIFDAVIVCVSLIVLRVLWVFLGAFVSRLVPVTRKNESAPPMKNVFLIGWLGMRGVVSLAAALALPEHLPNGSLLPMRDLILFLTFAVILVTLVGQSLTLPAVVKALKIESAGYDRCEEAEARRRAIAAALQTFAGLPDSHATTMLRGLYNHRLDHLADCESQPELPDPEHTLHRQAIRAQRATYVELRNNSQISDELQRKLERELDLEESQIPEVAETPPDPPPPKNI